jgi:hypothetical protein
MSYTGGSRSKNESRGAVHLQKTLIGFWLMAGNPRPGQLGLRNKPAKRPRLETVGNLLHDPLRTLVLF